MTDKITQLVLGAQQGLARPTARDFKALGSDLDGFNRSWHLMRQTGIGGSDVAAICGLSPFASPIDIWLAKTEPAPLEEPEPTEPMRWGHLLEPVIATEYQRREGRDVLGPFETWRHPDRSWHLVTPDRIVPSESRTRAFSQDLGDYLGEIDKGLEIKTAGQWGARNFGDEGSDDLPPYYLCQDAHYMGALDVERWDLAALLNTNDLRVFVTERDRELEAYLLEECERFWGYVQRREPPPVDGTESFATYLRARFKTTTGEYRIADEEVERHAGMLRELLGTKRIVDKEIELHRQHIQLAIGDADGIETSQGALTFKHQKAKVNWKDAALTMSSRLKLSAKQFGEISDAARGRAPRVFRTPAAWAKEPAATTTNTTTEATVRN